MDANDHSPDSAAFAEAAIPIPGLQLSLQLGFCVVTLDEHDIVQFVHGQLGVINSDAAGVEFESFIADGGHGAVRQILRAVRSHPGVGMTTVAPVADETDRWVDMRACVLDAESRTLLLVMSDATARVHSQQSMQAVFDHSSDGHVFFSATGIIQGNHAAARIMGFEHAHELLGRDLLDLTQSPLEQDSGWASGELAPLLTQRALTTETEVRFEWTYTAGQEGRTPVTIAVRPTELRGKRVALATIVDVTTQKRIEKELVDARDAAAAAAKFKGDFLAAMSHEIRTPLNGVIGMVDLLARTDMSADQARMLHTVTESAQSLLAILNDVLDLSKIEAGKLIVQEAPDDVATILTGVAETFGPGAAAKDLQLSVIVGPQVNWHHIDGQRLRQILLNLVGNAVKFTRAGTIVLSAKVIKDQLAIEVRDSGIGMDDETLARVFEPFEQASNGTSASYGGTGLGLAIVRQLVNLMGGSVDCSSAPGQGTSFHIFLPAPRVRNRTPVTSPSGLSSLTAWVDTTLPPHARKAVMATCARSDLRCVADRSQASLHFGWDNGQVTVTHKVDEVSVPTTPLTPERILDAIAAVRHEQVTAPVAPEVPTLPTNTHPILVAEDNDTNRRVLAAQLDALEIEYVLVNDGAEAWRELAERPFSLLLTDCNMPNLDGWELTRWIRSGEDAETHLPVIALTAAGTTDEIARCHDAGMDNVLVKPIDIDQLAEALRPWLTPTRTAPKAAVGPELHSVGEPLRDLFSDSEAHAVFDDWVTSAWDLVMDIEEATGKSDAPEVRRLAHTLRSSAGSVGARNVRNLCAELEAAARSSDHQRLTALSPTLRRQISDADEAGQRYFAGLHAETH